MPTFRRSEARPEGADTATRSPSSLTTWSDESLVELLRLRRDLLVPEPSSLTALASRAASRPSTSRALATCDAPTLAVAEAVVALESASTERLGEATGLDAAPAVAHLAALGLVHDDDGAWSPVPHLSEALGPHPAGLGPVMATHPGAPTGPDELDALLAAAPREARRTLDALTWGPPVGTVPEHDPPPGAAWLLEHHLLVRVGPTQLVLPRAIGLLARHGRTHADVATTPPLADAPERPPTTVAAEGVRAAEEIVREVGELARAWGDEPPPALRSGGVGVRDVRKFAARIGAPTEHAAFVVELAATAELVAPLHDVEGSAWAPTPAGEDHDGDVASRWARLVVAWSTTNRVPWLVGSRGEKGELRAALDPLLVRRWAPGARRQVLVALASWPEGAAPDAGAVHAWWAWHTPRQVPPLATVEAILAEAAWLGLTGAGALTGPGRAVATALAPDGGARPDAGVLAAALEAALPPAIDDLLLQADLTGVVPGRPTPALADLLAASADVESRGGALTVRFSQASVQRALDAGLDPDELMTRLSTHSRTGVPQPLEYAIRDAARRHGHLRTGSASSYLRSDDPGVLTALLADAALDPLGLRAIAPTVVVAQVPAVEVARVLRARGHAPAIEGSDGAVLSLDVGRRRSVAPSPRRPRGDGDTSAEAPLTGDALTAVVRSLRHGEERSQRVLASRAAGAAADDPAHALAALRRAVEAGTDVWLAVAGPSGAVQRRRVRPLRVDAGRIRVRDLAREADITVAAHRIVAVD
ncbi:conserved hypothetical protein [Beutenbergia cavernae DSM 12333]|uniref:Helicase XPB/Ssl2 N-terminal domain-containing protein n=1 Tax=Beutenbergia cavernae (strain ATCC BAA-8 / DSM 12333 / CCUG 43141 / JCM 11478 / NBRC 16432 / NCIMB 13614 / HKI 0122) TaxID=471853 RepID=C5BZD6_BEUC1|nr:helicase-associated domain-containing protein [Beutenbergia cavernae]ACQ79108.1 conserved hypothetical protein [Beutenbergia cavernae DSM 12333]